MVRIKPYDSSSKSWNDILDKQLNIPMNQREYSWTDKELKQFINDIINIFEEDKYVEKMGSIINLHHNSRNEIYDGQQRTITTILTIYNIAQKLSPDPMGLKIISKLALDENMDELNEEQIKLKDDKKIDIVPKIFCVNPFDMTALCDVFNSKCNDHFIDNIVYEDSEKYRCNICNENITENKSNAYRHLEKKHNILCKPKTNSKIYNANETIYNLLSNLEFDHVKYKKLYKFIMNDIDIQFCSCSDPIYVSRIFDWENSRGNDVLGLDVVKNHILVEIDDDKKCEVYDKWEKYKKIKNNIYRNDYGKKLMDIGIQLYNNKIVRPKYIDEPYKRIIESEDTYSELIKYFDIMNKLIQIMEDITTDKYGRFIMNSNQVSITWEGFMYLLLPIFYKTESVNPDFIKLIVKWYFRNVGIKSNTFNNLAYSNKMIDITNNVLKNPDYNYYNEIKGLFENEMDDRINPDKYENTLESISLKRVVAAHLLMFLERSKSNDIVTIPLNYTIEHVIPQSKIDGLKDRKLIHNLGNLTILEGSNSENGHRGNSSLGNKKYVDKVISYKSSSSFITKQLGENYSDFKEEHIIKRCKELSKQLNEQLQY
jgi:hypothetical protein